MENPESNFHHQLDLNGGLISIVGDLFVKYRFPCGQIVFYMSRRSYKKNLLIEGILNIDLY